ncbi:MAG: DUF960 family protein [Eubacteriales bacterium]
MFGSNRYITRGIESTVPVWLQNMLWYSIDAMRVDRKDYLQVFNLTYSNGVQRVVHTQEESPYERIYNIGTDLGATTKVFVIDSESYCTMMLASDY